jgi:hypothetical protein
MLFRTFNMMCQATSREHSQPAAFFLPFCRCAQLCGLHNAVLALRLFDDIAPRLAYSIDRPPDVYGIRRLGMILGDYLQEMNRLSFIDVDIVLSSYADRVLGLMRTFLASEVRLDSEFFEAKFRKAIVRFNGYCTSLTRIREVCGTSPVTWKCDMQELDVYIQKVELILNPIVEIFDVDDLRANSLPLARALMDVAVLAGSLNGIPANVFPESAYEIATGLEDEQMRCTLATVAQQIAELRQALATAVPSGPVVGDERLRRVRHRATLEARATALAVHADGYDKTPGTRERPVTIMVQPAQGRLRQIGSGIIPPTLPRSGRKSPD